MGELEKIADAKAQASGGRIIDQLRADMEAFHRKQSAKHMLQSGNTVIDSQALCARSLEEQGKAVIGHFEWVIQESLWISSSLIDRLASRAREHLQPIMGASRDLMKMATDRAGNPPLLAKSIVELETVRDRVAAEIDLALRAVTAQTKRRGLRNIGKGVAGWISKLFGR